MSRSILRLASITLACLAGAPLAAQAPEAIWHEVDLAEGIFALVTVDGVNPSSYANTVVVSGSSGTFQLALDLTRTPQPTGFVSVTPSETWNFQAWHRDSSVGIPLSNFTDAVSVTFQ